MTRFIAAYDTEKAGDCLTACRVIREVHEQLGVPATFYIVGKRLEEEGAGYRELLGDVPEFEIASHTYSHKMLRDNPWCGPAVTPEMRRIEVMEGKAWVERVFERPCLGLRPGCSFTDGLTGATDVLEAVAEAGFKYVSSQAWGPEYSLPAPLATPYTYAADGYPDLWEMPCHGWHENVVKGHSLTTQPRRLLSWPPLYPEAIPPGPIQTPEEEWTLNCVFIDRAVEEGLPYVSLIWHPWSLYRFDPEMKMLKLTFEYARACGLEFDTYANEWQRQAAVVPGQIAST